jgi:subfamily B ATP-binding cassette protein MsbA
MEIITYFKLYFRLTRGKILIFLGLTLAAIFFQSLAASMFLTVLDFGKSAQGSNFVTKTVFFAVSLIGLKEPQSVLAFLLTSASVCFFISSAFLIMTTVWETKLQAMLLLNIQPKSAEDLLSADYQYFLSQNPGALNNIIIQQTNQVAQSFKFYGTIIVNTLFACMYTALPFIMNPTMAAIMVIVGLPFVFLIRKINRKTRQLSVESVDEYSDLYNLLLQTLNNFKYLKSTFTHPPVVSKIRHRSDMLGANMRSLALWGSLSSYGITPFMVMIISILIFWQVAFMKTPVLDAVAVLAFLYAASQKLITIPTSWQKFLGSYGALESYLRYNDEVLKRREKLDGKRAAPDFGKPMRFENVSFKYDAAETEALSNLSFEIKPNTSVAFAGGSGAGKSTVINLICGLLTPTAGKITLGGADLRDTDLEKLRGGTGYVTQEPVIFNDTVKNNISLWSPDAGEKRVAEAARMARADEFIQKMPDGYESMLGEHGINISGGQRQRISIARELYRNTPVIILDEATSSLDSETEQFIQESINEFSGQKTVVIVAHRLATIKNCDVIYVLDKGRVAESGSYDGLCAKGGIFAGMAARQSLERG